MGFEISGPLAADDSVAVNLPGKADAGFAAMLSEQDAGTVTGSRRTKELEASEDFRLRVGVDSLLLQETFPGAALNSAIWTAPVTTMTVAVSGGFLTLNAGLSVATSVVARVSSYRSFPTLATCELYGEIVAQIVQLPQANNVTEWGFGIASASTAPTDGAFFRLNAAGEFRCVVVNNSTEIQSGTLDFAALVGASTSRHFLVSVADDRVKFWVNDVLVAIVNRATGGAAMVASGQLPILLRTYNTGATSVAQVLKVGLASVWVGDPMLGRAWVDSICGAGGHASQGQTGGTMGSTALFTNSLAAGAGAAAANTTAALGSGLGGQFALQPTLAVPTDGIISSYQVPAGTAALPGKSLVIRGIKIQGVVTTAFIGGPVLGVWSLAYGHTAVSLATAEAATTKAARRVPLGIQTFAVTAAVGARDDREISMTFASPIVVQPGEFVQTVLKNVGTVTSTGVILFTVAFDASFE